MKVQDILNAKGAGFSTIRPTATVAAAVGRLKAEGIGALVVTDQSEALLGLVAERDIVQGLAERGADLLQLTVADIMHKRPGTCAPEDDVKEIMATMTTKRRRHLVVLTDGKLSGIVSIGDVVKNRLDEMALETSMLRDAYIARH